MREDLGENKQVPLGSYQHWLQCKPMWRKWAYQMGCSIDEASDWEQESYMVFREAARTYQVEHGITFTAYYHMVLYRYGKKCLYKRRAHLLYESEGGGNGTEEACIEAHRVGESLEEDVIKKEQRLADSRLITQGLDRLSLIERRIIEAFYFKEQSLQQVAEAVGMTYDAVECKKRRTLKKLRRYIG